LVSWVVEDPGEGVGHLLACGFGLLLVVLFQLGLDHLLDQVLQLLWGGRELGVNLHVSGFCGSGGEGFLVEFLQFKGPVVAGLLVLVLLDGGGKYFDSEVPKFTDALDGGLLL